MFHKDPSLKMLTCSVVDKLMVFGTVDVSKTLIENSTVIGQAGQPSLFFVTVMTDKGCRKVDFNG
jgi:hypothetical protein